MKSADDNMRNGLAVALRNEGIDWASLCQQSQQLVLFGSRACGKDSPSADWDLLRVLLPFTAGEPRRRRRIGRIDVLEVRADYVETHEWLHSEVANHIARYGLLLHGNDSWSSAAALGQPAVDRKLCDIRRELDALRSVWNRIAPAFQKRRARRLRLQLQRLGYLERIEAVPATFVLEKDWREHSKRSATGNLRRLGFGYDSSDDEIERSILSS